jgi:hypothetical protein
LAYLFYPIIAISVLTESLMLSVVAFPLATNGTPAVAVIYSPMVTPFYF